MTLKVCLVYFFETWRPFIKTTNLSFGLAQVSDGWPFDVRRLKILPFDNANTSTFRTCIPWRAMKFPYAHVDHWWPHLYALNHFAALSPKYSKPYPQEGGLRLWSLILHAWSSVKLVLAISILCSWQKGSGWVIPGHKENSVSSDQGQVWSELRAGTPPRSTSCF